MELINKQYSSSETAVNYVMTMCDNGTTVAAYTRKYYVRAYAKLSVVVTFIVKYIVIPYMMWQKNYMIMH